MEDQSTVSGYNSFLNRLADFGLSYLSAGQGQQGTTAPPPAPPATQTRIFGYTIPQVLIGVGIGVLAIWLAKKLLK